MACTHHIPTNTYQHVVNQARHYVQLLRSVGSERHRQFRRLHLRLQQRRERRLRIHQMVMKMQVSA